MREITDLEEIERLKARLKSGKPLPQKTAAAFGREITDPVELSRLYATANPSRLVYYKTPNLGQVVDLVAAQGKDKNVVGDAFKSLAGGLTMGWPDLLTAVGGLVGSETLADWGMTGSEKIDELFGVEDPSFADKLINGVGFMLTLMTPALGLGKIGAVTKGISALAKGGRLGRLAPMLAGAGVMGGLESFMEAGDQIERKRKEGMSLEDAANEAAPAILPNIGVSMLMNAPLFSGLNVFPKAVLEAATEGGQEIYQGYLDDWVMQTGASGGAAGFADTVKKNWDSHWEEGGIGGIIGFGAAMVFGRKAGMSFRDKVKEAEEGQEGPQEAPGSPEEEAATVRIEEEGEAIRATRGIEPGMMAQMRDEMAALDEEGLAAALSDAKAALQKGATSMEQIARYAAAIDETMYRANDKAFGEFVARNPEKAKEMLADLQQALDEAEAEAKAKGEEAVLDIDDQMTAAWLSIHLYQSKQINAKQLWNIAKRFGIPSWVVDRIPRAEQRGQVPSGGMDPTTAGTVGVAVTPGEPGMPAPVEPAPVEPVKPEKPKAPTKPKKPAAEPEPTPSPKGAPGGGTATTKPGKVSAPAKPASQPSPEPPKKTRKRPPKDKGLPDKVYRFERTDLPYNVGDKIRLTGQAGRRVMSGKTFMTGKKVKGKPGTVRNVAVRSIASIDEKNDTVSYRVMYQNKYFNLDVVKSTGEVKQMYRVAFTKKGQLQSQDFAIAAQKLIKKGKIPSGALSKEEVKFEARQLTEVIESRYGPNIWTIERRVEGHTAEEAVALYKNRFGESGGFLLEQAAKLIESIGGRVFYFTGPEWYHGRHWGETGVLAVNIDHTISEMLNTHIHEILHAVGENNSDLRAKIVKAMADTGWAPIAGNAIQEEYARNNAWDLATAEGLESHLDETAARVVGNAATDPHFWQTLLEMDKPLYRKIVDLINKFLDHLKLSAQEKWAEEEWFKGADKKVMDEFDSVVETFQDVIFIAQDRAANKASAKKSSAKTGVNYVSSAPQIDEFFSRKKPRKSAAKPTDPPAMKKALNDATKLQQKADEQQEREAKYDVNKKGRYYVNWVDDLHGLKSVLDKGLKDAGLKGIDEMPMAASPYYTFRALVRGWTTIANRFLETGVRHLESAKNMGARGLHAIITDKKYGIADNYEQFGQYLIHKRILAIFDAKPALFTSREAQAKLEVARKLVPEVEQQHASWKKAAREIHDYSGNLIDYLQEAGVLSEKEARQIKTRYSFYAPLHLAEFVTEDGKLHRNTRGVFASRPVRRMRAIMGDAAIYNPIESMYKNTYAIVNAAQMNLGKVNTARVVDEIAKVDPEVAKHIGEILNLSTMRKPITRTRGEWYKAAGIKGKQKSAIRQKLREWEVDPDIINEVVTALELSEQTMEEQKKVWFTSIELKEGMIAYIEDGDFKIMRVHPEVYEAIAGLNKTQIDAVTRAMGKLTMMLREGAVLSPEFMARNPMRDVFNAAIVARGMIHSPMDLVRFGKAWFGGLKEARTKGELYDRWVMRGGAQADLVALDRDNINRRTAADLETATKQGALRFYLKNPKHWRAGLRAFSGYTEEATRLAVYNSLVRKNLNAGMEVREAELRAALESREASVDFQRRGRYGQIVNHYIPFFNASIGGIDKMVRSLTRGSKSERTAALIRAGLMITLPSILAWLDHKDDEWYKRLPRYEKNMYWHVKVGTNLDANGIPHDVIMRYPKPFELGLMFGSLWERYLDQAYTDDPRALESWAEQFASTVLPSVQQAVPPVSALYQAANNYDAWRQREIVKGSLKKLPNRLQYSENTTTTARFLGDLMNMSPLKIDFYIRSAFGGLGRYASDAVGAGIDMVSDRYDSDRLPARLVAPGAPIRETWPFVRAFVTSTPSAYDSYSDDFFHYLQKSESVQTEWNWTKKARIPKEELARDIEKSAHWLMMYKPIRKAADDVSKMTQTVKAIQFDNSGRFDEEQKRLMVDEIFYKRGQLMESVVNQVRELLADEERMEAIREQAERLSRQLRED